MENITHYLILKANDSLDLLTNVNGYIKKGWTPFGSLTVIRHETEDMYYIEYFQAMVKIK